MKNSGHGLLLVWQIVGTVVLSGVVSALLRKVVEQYMSAPRSLIVFVSLVVIISTLLIARANWSRWESNPDSAVLSEPSTPLPPMPDQTINISSTNQSGGITAHTVNLSDSSQPRGVLETAVPIFISALGESPRCEAKVEQHGLDSETKEFSGQMLTLLRMAGFNAEPPINVTMSPDIRPGIFIGTTTPGRPSSTALAMQSAFKAIGFDAMFEHTQADEPLTIIVGPKP